MDHTARSHSTVAAQSQHTDPAQTQHMETQHSHSTISMDHTAQCSQSGVGEAKESESKLTSTSSHRVPREVLLQANQAFGGAPRQVRVIPDHATGLVEVFLQPEVPAVRLRPQLVLQRSRVTARKIDGVTVHG